MPNSKFQPNPYIIGRPINEPEKFFGRESLFKFLEDNLNQGIKILLLHGQRRIGKSSILAQIPFQVAASDDQGFEFIIFDLQDKLRFSLGQILHELAKEITETLDLEIHVPTEQEITHNPNSFSGEFLPSVLHTLNTKGLVLLLDEFDVLSTSDSHASENKFFSYLSHLVSQIDNLFLIPVLGRKVSDLPDLLSIFHAPPYYKIGLLDSFSAERLIKRPAQNKLDYSAGAVEKIIKLSAGHPYLTQVLCFTLFSKAREAEIEVVHPEMVDSIIPQAIESAEGGLDWFWQGLSVLEKIIFAAVAETQKREELEPPIDFLKREYSLEIQEIEEELKTSVNNLIERDFIDTAGLRIKVELIRLWLLQRHPIQQAIRSLEELDLDAEQLYQTALSLHQRNNIDNAIKTYKIALSTNPNHFNSMLGLADAYLEQQNFYEAVKFYKRVYRLDQARTKVNYINALLKHGQDLWANQQKPRLAKNFFQEILNIDPENSDARERIQEISALEGENRSKSQRYVTLRKRSVVAAVPLVFCLIGGFGYFVGRSNFANRSERATCPENTSMIEGNCIPNQGITGTERTSDYISRGGKSLFENKGRTNTSRQKGIEAFGNGQYEEAIGHFQVALEKERNDPEILIYLNNARANIAGNKFTLATVVPAKVASGYAEEMLRGIAQAQNKFNQNGGIQGRLLEILLASDDNKASERSEPIAQAIAKLPSVIGIIGHNSSNATRKALKTYEISGLPIISPTSTSTSLDSHVFFRTVPSDVITGEKLASHSRDILKLDRAVIFYNPDSLYSNSLRESFEKSFTRLGGEITKKYDISSPSFDPDTAIQSIIRNDSAELGILLPNVDLRDKAAKIASSNERLKYDDINLEQKSLTLLGGDVLYNLSVVQKADGAMEGMIISVAWFAKDPDAQNFSKNADALWGGQVSWRTASSYDATQVFIEAIRSIVTVGIEPNREKILLALPSIRLSKNETSGKELYFIDGERGGKSSLVQVKNGRFENITDTLESLQ